MGLKCLGPSDRHGNVNAGHDFIAFRLEWPKGTHTFTLTYDDSVILRLAMEDAECNVVNARIDASLEKGREGLGK